jgi:SAM-dependent methyltransferase
VLVPDPAQFVADHLTYFFLPMAMSEALDDWLAEALAGAGWYEAMRRHCSTYGWDHYADGDPDEGGSGVSRHAGSAMQSLQTALDAMPVAPDGPALDIGCAAGRTTFALAERVPGRVLGIDVNVPLLRLARQALHEGEVVYPRRDLGRAYQRRRIAFSPACRERVDFWVADAHQPPFAARRFGTLAALNVIDCLERPAEALAALGGVMNRDAWAVISLPYDWSDAVTPVTEWIAGTSSSEVGEAETHLKAQLEAMGLRIVREWPHHPWLVRLHRRASVTYHTHLLLLASGEPQRGAAYR